MAFITRRGRTRTSLSEINVTPFVDVMLVLLVIFMLTAPILESGIEVELPKTRSVKVLSEEKVVVTIDRRQTIYVGNDPVNIHRLGSFVDRRLQCSVSGRGDNRRGLVLSASAGTDTRTTFTATSRRRD